MDYLNVFLGKHSDNYEYLQSLAEKKAKEMSTTLSLKVGEKKEIPFWTDGIPELIAIVNFEKQSNGKIIYDIDYSLGSL